MVFCGIYPADGARYGDCLLYTSFWLLCLLSFAIAVLVPLLCQLLMLPRIVKIQPRQAMGQL